MACCPTDAHRDAAYKVKFLHFARWGNLRTEVTCRAARCSQLQNNKIMPNDSNLIICPRCGDANAPKALVCSICGTRLPERNEAAPPVLVAQEAEPESIADTAEDEVPHEDTAREIDARRAHHLLERAFILVGRHEFEAAVLACRQALLLLPEYALGSALLGLLLKRQGDAPGSAAAYAKAKELVPDTLWETLSLDALHTVFKESETPVPAPEKPVVPAPTIATEVAAPPSDLQHEAPVAVKEVAAKPVVWPETVSPARDKSWMAYAAVGTAILIGLVWLYKSFTPPLPTPQDTTQAARPIGDPLVPGGASQLPPLPRGENQLSSPSGGNQAQPPPPPAGQRPVGSGSAGGQPAAQVAAPPAHQLGQSFAETRPAPTLSAAPATINPAGETARDGQTTQTSSAPATVALPLTPGGGVQSGGSTAGSLPPPRAPVEVPRSQGNSRPGTPHNSIPGAFQPGRP